MDSTYQTLVSEQNSSQDSTLESLTNSSRKYNLLFTMNLDEDIDSEFSNDSEKVDLKIDVEEVDNYETPKKRCRYDDNDKITGINEMEEEIERQLDAKAAKTNLTATNVKNILKHVIMNEDVISMVHNKVHNSDEKILYEPKLTRSKAKELASSMPDLPWSITPKKKTVSPHMQVLVNNDLLHEDSSDDEYDPDKDHPEPSEDEGDTVEGSDVDSEPLTPITVVNTTEPIDTNIMQENHYNFNDNEFKIPVAPYVPTEEESIGQRTRSKLCLSETPIEQLEREFIPPDILPDMYHNGHLANDPNWGELFNSNGLFLDDDDVNDPSYNILEDNETETVDKEELRSDKTVKVSKKEKDLLYEELNDFNDMSTNNSLPRLNNDQSRKKKSLDGINLMESNLNNSSNEIMYDSFQVLEEPTIRCHVSQEQCNIISYQLEQHVQLMTQHFMMSYMHPKSEIHVQSTECKNNLNNLIQLQHPNHPLFNISNLPDAMKLINVWENKLDDKTFCESYVKQLEFDMEHGINQSKRRHKYVAKFNSELLEVLMDSKALMYPELLPHIPFRVETLFQTNLTYCKSEENLLALGIEKYLPYVKSSGRRFRSTKYTVYDAMCHVCKELMPNRKPDRLVHWMSSLRRPNVPYNAIQFYYEHGYAPVVTHNIPLKRENKSPKNCETSLLPKTWQDWIKNKENKKTPSSTPTNNNVKTLYKILPIKTAVPVEINQIINNPNNSFKTKKVIKSKNTTKQLAKTVNVKNKKLMTEVSSLPVETNTKLSTNSCGLSNNINKDANDKSTSSQQAKIINITDEHMILLNKSPARSEMKSKIREVIDSLTQLTNQSNNTEKNIILVMKPLLDNIADDLPNSHENIDLSIEYHDDEYGGDNCKCDCHENINIKHGITNHCKLCDDEYLNRKINLELLRELTPVKITSEGNDKNNTHASTEITRSLPIISPGRQAESSINNIQFDEPTQEQNSLKILSIMNNNNSEIVEPKAGKKFTLFNNDDSSMNSTNGTSSPTNSQSEEYNKIRELETELKNLPSELEEIDDDSSSTSNDSDDSSRSDDSDDSSTSDDSDDSSSELSDTETDSEPEQAVEDNNFECNQEENKSWTRQEDMVLLKNVQQDYSDDTFERVSKLLGDKTFDEVKKRCEILLKILQNMS